MRKNAQGPNTAEWYVTVAGVILIAVVVGLAAFDGFAHHSFEVGPARVSVSASPSLSPSSTVVVPPFGSIRASTHPIPLALGLSLEEVDLPQLERIAFEGLPDEGTVEELAADIRGGFTRAIGKGLITAFLLGGFVGWALRRSLRSTLVSAGAAIVAPVLLIALTAATLDLDAFKKPVFRGAVRYAPSLIELVQARANRIESLREQVGEMARDLTRYYRSPQSFATAGALSRTYRVLHVTDIHMDPVGLELVGDLSKEFGADLLINTGDINHYGSELEARVVARSLPKLRRQLFVPGNHESPAVVEAIDALPGTTVLTEDAVNVDGLRVFGVSDTASRELSADVDPETERTKGDRIGARLAREQVSGGLTPDIIAVHNTLMVPRLRIYAPVILAGHSHTPMLEEREGRWYLNTGTTGGIHFTRMRAEPHIPHSASILYYTESLPRRLVAIDQIEVFGLAGQSSLKRTIVDERLAGSSSSTPDARVPSVRPVEGLSIDAARTEDGALTLP